MAARKRRSFRRKRQNVEWSNNSVVTPTLINVAETFVELVPDGMGGSVVAADFLLKRIVGSFTLTPQSAATASANIGLAIFRSVHAPDGSRSTSVDPLSTDVDVGSQDILWQKQFKPNFGAQLDATALDLAVNIELDLKGRPTLRKLDKRNGITLVFRADVTARLQISFRLRILSALKL